MNKKSFLGDNAPWQRKNGGNLTQVLGEVIIRKVVEESNDETVGEGQSERRKIAAGGGKPCYRDRAFICKGSPDEG